MSGTSAISTAPVSLKPPDVGPGVKGVEWDRVKDPLFSQCPVISENGERLVLTQEAQDHLIALGIFLLESEEVQPFKFAQIIIPYLLEITDRLPKADIVRRRFQEHRKRIQKKLNLTSLIFH